MLCDMVYKADLINMFFFFFNQIFYYLFIYSYIYSTLQCIAQYEPV